MNEKYLYKVYVDEIGDIHCTKHKVIYSNDDYIYFKVEGFKSLGSIDRHISFYQRLEDVPPRTWECKYGSAYLAEAPDLSNISRERFKKPLYLCRIEELQNKIKLYEKSISESTKKITEIKSDIELYQHKIAELDNDRY